MIDISVVIVGCGSIGSHLAMCLAKSGVSKFTLVDKEIVVAENIPRHLCDMVDASKRIYKVEAVKNKLLAKFPDIACVSYSCDAIPFLEESKDEINRADYIIVALGQFAIERRINFLTRSGVLRIPVIFVWIEPYGVGGHIVFIHPDKGGCYSCCFNDKGEFLYSIAVQDQQFLKKEAGCQSTFLPYSSIDAESFVLMACKQIINISIQTPALSVAYSWVGDLEEFNKLGYQISDNYLADIPFRFKHREIVPYLDCELCKNKS
jgi:molybdopterin/thiamine biosynthesis adenylyltransferase